MSTATKMLYDFIDVAERNRKYSPNAAAGLRVAIRLFEEVLHDEEKESLDTFRNNLDPIYQEVVRKNSGSKSLQTLLTYKRRVERLLSDYAQYGIDPTKMASWSSRTPSSKRPASKKSSKDTPNEPSSMPSEESAGAMLARFELPLRPDAKAIILVPADLTIQEAGRLKGLIDSLASE